MRAVRRPRALVVTVLALLLAATAPVAAPAQAASRCTTNVISLERSGLLSALAIQDGRVAHGFVADADRPLPFRIRSMTTISHSLRNDTDPSGFSGHLVLTTTGDLHQMTLAWDDRRGTVRYAGSQLLNTTFDGFREITFGETSKALYGVHQDGGLYRYPVGQSYQPLRGTLIGRGWATMSQLRQAPINHGATGGASIETMFAISTRTGELHAYTFDAQRPVALSHTRLAARSWAPMLLVADRCRMGGVIAVHRTTREASVYHDPDGRDPWTAIRFVGSVASRWWATPLTTG